MAKHRTRTASYGDGGFYFTQPVGAGGGYSDGGFYFTQPVGAGGGYAGPSAHRLVRNTAFAHPAYGRAHHGYGVTAGGANKLAPVSPPKFGAGGTSADTRGTGIDKEPDTKKAAARGKPADIKAFEEAAQAYGKAKFWVTFWGSVEMNAGSKFFGSTAKKKKQDADAALVAAKRALVDRRTVLLQGVPPFPKSNRTGGLPADRAGKALLAYEEAQIDKGYYAEAYRNLSGGKTRKPSKTVFDRIVEDIVPPLGNARWDKSDYAVWRRKAMPDRKPYVKAARAYLLADIQSDFRKGIPSWMGFGTRYAKEVGVSSYALEIPEDTFDIDYESSSQRVNVVEMNASENLQEALFTKAFDENVTSLRRQQDDKHAALPARVDATKKEWEAARKEHVEQTREAQQLSIEQQNNALTARSKRREAETAYARTRDAAAEALAGRRDAEGMAAVAKVEDTRLAAEVAERGAQTAQTQAQKALQAAQQVARLAAAAGGLADGDREIADSMSQSAGRASADARESANIAAAQVAIAEAARVVEQRRLEEEAARQNALAQQAAATDALAKAQGAQARADAAKNVYERAVEANKVGAVSAADVELALREYERLNTLALGEKAKSDAEKAKADALAGEAARKTEETKAAEADKDQITGDLFTPGEQAADRVLEPAGGVTAISKKGEMAGESFFARNKTPILAAVLVGGAAFAWWYTRNQK